jgi:hypothetical protein
MGMEDKVFDEITMDENRLMRIYKKNTCMMGTCLSFVDLSALSFVD